MRFQHPMILSETVQNPKPDRRYKGQVEAAVEWKKDSLWFLIPRSDTEVAKLVCHGQHGVILQHHKDQFEVIQAKLVPYETGKPGQEKRDFDVAKHICDLNPEYVLRLMVRRGMVTTEQLGLLQRDLDEMEDDEYEQL